MTCPSTHSDLAHLASVQNLGGKLRRTEVIAADQAYSLTLFRSIVRCKRNKIALPSR